MAQKKRIIIIDDHPLFREGLKSIIVRSTRYEVVGEAGNGRDGLQISKELKPDIALVDIVLPDQSGLGLIHDILKFSPHTRIIIISVHSKIDYIVKAFQSGAFGYIVKVSAADKLMEGIERVLQGDYFMDTAVSQQVVKKLAGLTAKEKVVTGSGYDALTPREQEVMILLAEGLSSQHVADKLFISPKTAENHRSNIMRKLGLQSTIELVRYAAKLGVIDIDSWKE
ncbi:MAG: response regulator transcription factor [Euryarchaeota archaeon]|nr:response regulator transcription factor [Euryarchaeota archaeon]